MGPFETERLLWRALSLADLDILFALLYTDPDVNGMYSNWGGNREAVSERTADPL